MSNTLARFKRPSNEHLASFRPKMEQTRKDNDRGFTPVFIEGVGVAGVRVSPATALQVATYYACIRNISEDIAKIPLYLYQYEDVEQKRKRKAVDHPVYRLLYSSPNPDMTAQTFRETLLAWALAWGNGVASIDTKGTGYAQQLNLLEPWHLKIERNPNTNRVQYRYNRNGRGRFEYYTPEDVIHIHGLGSNGVTGYSVAEYAANTLGLALSSQTHVANFFKKGAMPVSTLELDGMMPEVERIEALRKQWDDTYSGVNNAGKVIILEGGMKFKPISLPLKDIQFLELRKFEKGEIASLFRMPLWKLQDSEGTPYVSTQDGQESLYINDCLSPWMARERNENSRKLLIPEEQAAFCFGQDTKELIKMDARTRADYVKTRIQTGTMTPNEGRDFEDENPSNDPAMNEFYMQGAMMPINKLGQQVQKPGLTTESGVEKKEEAEAQLNYFLTEACERLERKELKAVSAALTKYSDKGAYTMWLRAFWGQQRAYINSEIISALQGFKMDMTEELAKNILAWCMAEENYQVSIFKEPEIKITVKDTEIKTKVDPTTGARTHTKEKPEVVKEEIKNGLPENIVNKGGLLQTIQKHFRGDK